MININVLNQNNNYSLGKPHIKTPFSNLQIGETTITSGNMGKLIPVYVQEMQPNQGIHTAQAMNIQFTPLVTNLMHQIKGEIISYFVPYRLLWDKWEDFITGGDTGLENPEMPYTTFDRVMTQKVKNNHAVANWPIWEKISKFTEKLKQDNPASVSAISDAEEKVMNLFTGLTSLYQNGTKASIIPDWSVNNAANIKNTILMPLDTKHIVWNKNLTNAEIQVLILQQAYEILKDTFEHSLWDYIGLPYNSSMLVTWLLYQSDEWENRFINEESNGMGEMLGYYHAITQPISSLPFRAYKKIYNDWIRLTDWETEIEVEKDAIIDVEDGNYDWDYFTRARRYQLRGAMPSIPVVDNSKIQLQLYQNTVLQTPTEKFSLFVNSAPGTVEFHGETDIGEEAKIVNLVNDPSKEKYYMRFDNMITAAALMNYYTANAKIRPRYAEHLLNRWNVKIQDARLQLAEFIGANSIQITSQGVIQTSAGSEGQTQQGNITGQLWGNGSNMDIHFRALEHGVVISMLIIKPANCYEQGFQPMLKKRTRFELPTPEMVNLPDVPIFANELIPHEDGIIGYKSIYDEYRTKTNKVTGRLRPSNPNGLSSYTMARRLNSVAIDAIVKCKPDTKRIKQYANEPDFILITSISTQTVIPLPYTSDVAINL